MTMTGIPKTVLLTTGVMIGLAFVACGGDANANAPATSTPAVDSTQAAQHAPRPTTSVTSATPSVTAPSTSASLTGTAPQSAASAPAAMPTQTAPTPLPPTSVPTAAPTPVPPTPTPEPSAPLTATVSIGDNFFGPGTVTIAAGGTVAWNWTGTGFHDVSGDGFQSETQKSGTYSFTFTTPGTYAYICEVHQSSRPPMRGTVIVQ